MRWVYRHVALFVFFFFKQKTAYEMRISDWSSDVCSESRYAEPSKRSKGTRPKDSHALRCDPGASRGSHEGPAEAAPSNHFSCSEPTPVTSRGVKPDRPGAPQRRRLTNRKSTRMNSSQ